MKLSKLYLYLGLTLLGLLSFIPSGCCSSGPISGGLADFSDRHRFRQHQEIQLKI